MPYRVILLQAAAPPKPALGQPCNGCGVCCATEPCPLGMVLSRCRHGACRALQWDEAQGQYRCGVLAQPQAWWPDALPVSWARALARRWIAAGFGCDSNLQTSPAPADSPKAAAEVPGPLA